MKLYLVRHGQTNYNVQHICNDDPSEDVYLTELGKNQAEQLAEDLKSVQVDAIYVSQLKRTQQTAEIIKAHHSGTSTIIDARLNDNRSGFNGQPSKIYVEKLKTADNKWEVRFNDGESFNDVMQRINYFINDLKTNNYNSVLIVTSQAIIMTFLRIIDEMTDEEAWTFPIETGALVELAI